MILVLEETVALRVEFQFRSSAVNLSSMQQHFHQEIQPVVLYYALFYRHLYEENIR